MMTAAEYLKAKYKMTQNCRIRCKSCVLSDTNNGLSVGCNALEKEHTEKAIEIMEIWAKEHPVKTILTDVLAKHPNIPLNKDGTPRICPFTLGYTDKNDCDWDCIKCWNRELGEEHGA